MKHFTQKFFGWVPVGPVVKFFGIGSLEELQDMWLGFAVFFFMILMVMVTGHYQDTPYDWGVLMLKLFLIGFPVGLFCTNIFMSRKFFLSTEIVIDKVVSNFLVIGATMPALVAGINSLSIYINGLCKTLLICNEWIAVILAGLVVILYPFMLYYYMLHFKPWPTNRIDVEFPNSLGVMIDDIIIAIYTIFIVYLTFFIPFDISGRMMVEYMEYVSYGLSH